MNSTLTDLTARLKKVSEGKLGMKPSKLLVLALLVFVVLGLVSCTTGDESLLIASFWIKHTENGYEVVPTFDTLTLDTDQRARVREWIEAEQKDPTIYRIDIVSSFGRRESHFTTAAYYPPDTDVGEALREREIPIGSEAYLDPINIFVSDRTKRIEVYIADELVHSITSFNQEFSIKAFSISESEAIVNDELTSGHEITWSVEAQDTSGLWVTIEYQSSPDYWDPLVLGTPKMEGSLFILPDHIQSTLDQLNLRISVTDGFSTQSQVLNGVIDLEKKLELQLRGITGEHSVGSHDGIELWFDDPETGASCDGRGCTFGENEGKYKVTWFSDVQNICPTDIYDGTLNYVYKSEGTHRIGARVEHIEKPELSAEIYVDVEVSPGDLGFTDPSPDCSDVVFGE